MSVGTHHHRPNHRHAAELQHLIADPSFQKMWARPFRVVTSKQIPDTAGYNVAGSVFYIDREFYNAVMSHRIVVPGMTAAQIIRAILVHERTEKALLDALNDINSYQAAHEMATISEHLAVQAVGAKPREYENAIRAAVKFNETKPLASPPLDLDAEPYIDEPDAMDKRAIAEMIKLGVVDASKGPKEPNKYGPSKGPNTCALCANWQSGPRQELSPCAKISGLVRTNYWCRKWTAKNAPDSAPRPGQQPIQTG